MFPANISSHTSYSLLEYALRGRFRGVREGSCALSLLDPGSTLTNSNESVGTVENSIYCTKGSVTKQQSLNVKTTQKLISFNNCFLRILENAMISLAKFRTRRRHLPAAV